MPSNDRPVKIVRVIARLNMGGPALHVAYLSNGLRERGYEVEDAHRFYGMASAFADPAKYDLYECKQLESERKNLATRAAELQGLIAKAQAGVAGPVVAEIAYRNEYIAVRGQANNAEEAWRRNKCHETPPSAATPSGSTPSASSASPANDKPAHSLVRSGNAVY